MMDTELIHSGRIQTAFIAAFALLLLIAAVTLLLHRPAEAQVNDKAVGNVSVSSPNPGELSVRWDAPSDAPDDYRVTWKKSSGKWTSYKDDNTVDGGNAFPTGTSHTATGLEEGTEYSVRVRARYHDGNGNVEESGPWSTSVEITVAAQPPPPPTEEPTEEPSPPAKPTGLSTGPSHDSVALSWTDPGDSSITSYQVLRGPDAANLAVLVDNTGSGSLSYTDSTVAAETTYAYAIKARNADGLSPQADAVSVTTPAAPVETPVPEQLPSASFTLDGKALDTSGACSQDDISSVSDDCTINITTRSPVFAVRGTVDSDDRMTVRTGRDSAAVDAATATADQDYLRGTDRTATLTLAEGRHLLRVWADEDTTLGGSEEHFFRVNVLPYWELNGQELSRDSDCQSTAAPELAEITDSDCIVTQSGNTGSIRFHNVTTEQFNAYVSVNGSEVIREPEDAALGGPFTLALQSGDNLLRVRLASKGNIHKAESYGRNAFYYKVTTPSPPAKPTGITYGASHDNALMFWTDPNDDSITGYQVLRGEDADTLTVLEDDTGSASASYSDDTVEPETEYFYAIRARNAGGLGPQSDTVSVTTQAVPEELLTELAIAGAEFSLSGNDLDTTGTCSESDIDSIVDDCTIDIGSKSPVLRVDGTLDSDDRLRIRIGRDLAAALAAPQVAGDSDFRGTNQSVTLTFPEGRSLLRIFGDEDGTAGGEETHFFRVNVVPYWEWNGNILSKDSDCRDTTANAPAVGEITDDACIVTQFGNTAELRFFNVIKEHYNVYVEVNGSNVISEPSTTDLGSSFSVNLDAGDNLIRIRLAAKGGQPTAEVYDSDSFYYKVTATDVLVSNLGQSTGDVVSVFNERQVATQFTTGGNPNGYTVSEVRLPISVLDAAVVPVVEIYSDVSGDPGASIKTLTNPASITVSSTPAEATFDADDYKLIANTTYWIVVENPHASLRARLSVTTKDSEDTGGALGWSIANDGESGPIGGPFSLLGSLLTMQFAIKGALVTGASDATLSALALQDASNNAITIDPTFASDVEDYTATVANAVSRIKVEPTGNDTNATLQYLDSADTVLTDADTNTTVFDLDLAEGANIFKIKVTAEDTVTTKTYTVRIRRAETDDLVSNLGQTSRPSPTALGGGSHLATQFTTGDNTAGYTVSKVNLTIAIGTASVTPVVSIYSDVSGSPGASIKTLTNPASITVSSTTTSEVEFDADDYSLDANTPYWLMIEKPAGSDEIIVETTASDSEDAGFASGWSIGNISEISSDAGMTFTDLSIGRTVKIAVKGALTPGSSDASLSDLALKDGSNNVVPLFPTFEFDYTGSTNPYAASVNNAVSRIKVEPTKRDDNASIRYLDSNDVALMDADTNTAVFDVDLAEGENILKLEVTAEDSTTMVTYTLRIRRAAADELVSNLGQYGLGTDVLGVPFRTKDTKGIASQFTTGSNPGGYTISAVRLDIGVVDSAAPLVSIYSDSSGRPGTSLKVLTNPTGIPSISQTDFDNLNIRTAELNYDASSFTLDPNTPFWIVVEQASGTTAILLSSTETLGEDQGAAPGWSIGDNSHQRQSTQTWSNANSTVFPVRMAVKGKATPSAGTPPALQSAEIDGAELTLGFSNTLDATSRPARSAFEVKVRGTAVSLSSSNPVSISGSAVTLRLGSPVTAGDTVTVSYTEPATNPIKDGAALVAPSFTNEPVFNNTPNAEPTGRPVISGIPERGQTLTADTSGIRDADGLSNPRYIYRWGRVDGATKVTIIETISPTYLLTRDDIGKKIEVYVSFHDDAGVRRILVSDQFPSSGTIRNKANNQPTGRPALSGTNQVGHTLTADTSGIGDRDGLTSPGYTYQWERQVSGVYTDIADANTMVYTLSPADQGKRVRVRVTFTDDDENVHTLESSPSGVVQAQTSLPSSKVKVSLDATAYVVEEGKTIRVTVTLAEAPVEDPVYIPFTVTPGNGASRSDFSAWSSYTRQLRFDVGDTTDRINVHANDDTLNDDGETLTLCLGDLPDPYATLAGLDCATVNIMDNDDPNSVRVTFRSDTYWASEDGNPAWPRISVHPVPDRQITIPITFTRGGDLSGSDHSTVTTRVTFGPGLYGVHGDGHLSDNRTYASFPIEIWAIDDDDDDDGEYMDLAFGELPPFVSAGGTGKFSYRPTTARVWFNDNEFTQVDVTDPPNPLGLSKRMRVSFADAELEAKEGQYSNGTTATVRVRLSRRRDMESTVIIPITVTPHDGARPGVDYIATEIPSQLTFLPGQTEQSFRVRAVNDDIDDDGEYLTFSFGTLPDDLVYAGDQTTVRVNLVDDDDPPVDVFFEQANYEVTNVIRDGTTEYARLNVKVKLSAAPERFIDVGIVAESIRGYGSIHFEYSAYIPRGPHDGAHFYEEDTEFTLQIYISARGGFDPNQTYRLKFDGMSYKMFVGSPAMATITINPDS